MVSGLLTIRGHLWSLTEICHYAEETVGDYLRAQVSAESCGDV